MATVLERPSTYTPASFGGVTNKFVIESSIPLPPKAYHFSGRVAKYPFSQMRVGDSFAVPLSSYNASGKRRINANIVASTVSNCARRYAKTHNPTARFATRKIDDRTVRVWRTA